jgi:hypothetical protein
MRYRSIRAQAARRAAREHSFSESLESRVLLAQTPFGAMPHVSLQVGANIQAEDFDLGGEGVAYHDLTPSQNTGGAYRTSEGVDEKFTPVADAGLGNGGYRISDAFPGEWLEYTFQVDQAGTYEFDVRAGAPGVGGTFHLTVDDAAAGGTFAVPNTGSYDNMQNVRIRGINLTTGVHVLRLTFDTEAGNTGAAGAFNWINIVNNDETLPRVQLSNEGLVLDEGGPRGSALNLIRDTDASRAAVNLDISIGGTAKAGNTLGSDYIRPFDGSTFTLPQDSAGYSFNFTTLEDTEREPDETIVVTLNPSPSYVVIGQTTETFTLVDDDQNTASLRATADAYVRDGSYANTNFGNATTLEVKRDAIGYNRETDLRFDLSNIASNRVATLRLFGSIASSTQQPVLAVIPGSGPNESTWTESGVTYNTRPASGGSLSWDATISGTTPRWYEWNVTDMVAQAKAAGARSITFVVRSLTTTTPQVIFNSDEAASNRPELRIQPDDVTTPPTSQLAIVLDKRRITVPEGGSGQFHVSLSAQPAVTTVVNVLNFSGSETRDKFAASPKQLTFTPANWNVPQTVTITSPEDSDFTNDAGGFSFASPGLSSYGAVVTQDDNDVFVPPPPQVLRATGDAFVRDGSFANTNFGSSTSLELKTDAVGYDRDIYLKFDLTQLQFTGRFVLRLFGKIDSSIEKPTVDLFGSTVVSGTEFNESTLTFNNRPAAGTLVGSTTVSGSTGKYYDFDVTGWLGTEIAFGATEVMFVLHSTSKTTPQLVFNSDEASANRPQLVVSP